MDIHINVRCTPYANSDLGSIQPWVSNPGDLNLELGSTLSWVSNPSGSEPWFGFNPAMGFEPKRVRIQIWVWLSSGFDPNSGFFLCGLREEEKGERREMGFGKKKVKRRESKNDGRLKMKRKENKKKKFKEKKKLRGSQISCQHQSKCVSVTFLFNFSHLSPSPYWD